MSAPTCRLCASPKTELLFFAENVHGRHPLSEERFGIYECARCSVVFVDIDTSGDYYNRYYPTNYYQESHGLLSRGILSVLRELSFRKKLRLIMSRKPAGNRLLEIGCGRGEFLERLPRSFQKHAIEINEAACQFVRENYSDVSIYSLRLDADDFEPSSLGQYDVIFAWHVLEHIGNPQAFVRRLSKLLSNDGVIVLDLPNRDSFGFRFTKNVWFHLDTPRHLFFYSYRSLGCLLREHDLDIVGYQGNSTDYLHDLSASSYAKLRTKSVFVNAILALLVFPLAFFVRSAVSRFAPRVSELNTYVVKHKTDLRGAN